jgi:hypothetical protein
MYSVLPNIHGHLSTRCLLALPIVHNHSSLATMSTCTVSVYTSRDPCARLLARLPDKQRTCTPRMEVVSRSPKNARCFSSAAAGNRESRHVCLSRWAGRDLPTHDIQRLGSPRSRQGCRVNCLFSCSRSCKSRSSRLPVRYGALVVDPPGMPKLHRDEGIRY